MHFLKYLSILALLAVQYSFQDSASSEELGVKELFQESSESNSGSSESLPSSSEDQSDEAAPSPDTMTTFFFPVTTTLSPMRVPYTTVRFSKQGRTTKGPFFRTTVLYPNRNSFKDKMENVGKNVKKFFKKLFKREVTDSTSDNENREKRSLLDKAKGLKDKLKDKTDKLKEKVLSKLF